MISEVGGTNGGGDITPPSPDGMTSMASAKPSVPMAMPANGSGGAAPLAIYPPGFDMSGFIIFDPATEEWVSGDGYVINTPSVNPAYAGGIQPMDDSGGESDSGPYTGFYRVVREGAHLFGVTNGMIFSGVVTIPVEVANDSGDLMSLSLTEADSPVSDVSIATAPFQEPLQLEMDTTQMSNGVHQISASARWDDTNGGLWEADSPPISVTVSNEISFENWMPSFGELGNSLLIRATSAHTNTDWYIDVYDSQYSYIGTFGGHTDDGDISVVWNLIGPYGEPHTNDNFFIFYISTEYVDPVTPPIYKVTDPWSGPGAWVAVEQHAWDSTYDHEILYAELGGFVGAAQNAGWQVNPSPYQGTYGIAPYALHFGASDPQGDTDWQAFRDALYTPSSRNLVYFGHGGPDGLGQNPANTNRFITATEIASRLHTIPAGQTNRHAFRFVFLDGCSTAKGNLPEAFGILHREVFDLDEYTAASLRPSAFVGWSADKWITFLWGIYLNYDHVYFIQHIQIQMLLGWGLQESIDYAAHAPDVHWAFVWLNQMQVYGYYDLHIGQYNN